MKKCLSCCIVLFLASPMFAQIAKQQSAAKWNQTNTTMCQVPFGNNTSKGNLIAVWTSWQDTSTTTFTASVGDSEHNGVNGFYPSAVGPTPQSAANPPFSAQIFFAGNIRAGSDTVTVTYSGQVSSANCVIVEYGGADTLTPLDSVSEAISNTPSSTLDSGTVAPANANLLLFGAGTWDQGSLVAGGGFNAIQSSPSGNSITEQNTSAITINNTLQRATAVPNPTPPGGGNWIMQMAVFRAASWTTAGGTSSTRAHGLLYADQFPGADIGAQVNNAFAALPLNAAGKPFGTIELGSVAYSFSSPILIKSPYVTLDCKGASLTFTKAPASAITLSDAPTTYDGNGGVRNCRLYGNGSAGQIGITLNEVTWSRIVNIGITGFTGSGSIGILFSNTSGTGVGFTENDELDDVRIGGSPIDIAFQDNCTGHSGCPSFAYNYFTHVDLSIGQGATAGMQLSNDATLNGGDYDIRCRGDAIHSITCLSLIQFANINLALLKIGGENGAVSGNVGVSTTSNTVFAPVNLYEQWNGGTPWTDSLANGTYIAYIYTPLNVGHIIGAAQGLSIGNASPMIPYSATLSTNSLGASQIFTFPNQSGTFVVSGTASTISSGFGTSPTLVVNNGTAAFTLNVGSGGTATTGILAMPRAANGWNCQVNDLTAAAANAAYNTRQTASSTTRVTVQNQTTSTGAAVAWGANDILGVSCFAY